MESNNIIFFSYGMDDFLMEIKSVFYLYIFIYSVLQKFESFFFLESMFSLNFVGNSSIHCIKHKKNQQLLSHSYYELFNNIFKAKFKKISLN